MYSESEKHIIKTLKRAGVKWSVIAEALRKNELALRQWWHRNSLLVDLPPKPIIKKRKTDGRMGMVIKRLAKEVPKIALRDYEARLINEGFKKNGIPSRSSIDRFLQRNSLVILSQRKKAFISDKNIAKRLEFAKKYKVNVHPLVYETIWSDETTVRKAPKDKKIQVRCHSSTKIEDRPINFQFQQGGFAVMFWGCFSIYGCGPLVALEGSQNQHTYKDLLENYVLPEIRAAAAMFGVDMTFMQDNAPCHKTKLIDRFFDENGIKTLDWPPQSPDLNPIENLWNWIKQKRQKKFGMPKDKVALINQIMEIWDEVDDKLLENLAQSVERRLDSVIRLGGRQTKY